MFCNILLSVLLVQFGQLFPLSNAVVVENVTSCAWDGVGFYISVKRDVIQKKLDSFRCSVSSECEDGPRLFVPGVPVLPDLHQADHHPVYIDFGYLTSHDFNDYLNGDPNNCVSTSGFEVAVTIPLLADSPNGSPVYALALAKFYERSRGDIPKTNLLYPYIPVDEIKRDKYEAVVRNGSDEMRVFFHELNHLCKPPSSIVKEEFDDLIFGIFHFGLPAPEYSFCDRHTFKSRFCSNADRVKCGLHRYAPNVCQMYWSNDIHRCQASVDVVNITEGFREFLLLENDPVKVLASEYLSGNSTVSLKYPCQE